MTKHLWRGRDWKERLGKRSDDPTVTPRVWTTYREFQVYLRAQEQKRKALLQDVDAYWRLETR